MHQKVPKFLVYKGKKELLHGLIDHAGAIFCCGLIESDVGTCYNSLNSGLIKAVR